MGNKPDALLTDSMTLLSTNKQWRKILSAVDTNQVLESIKPEPPHSRCQKGVGSGQSTSTTSSPKKKKPSVDALPHLEVFGLVAAFPLLLWVLDPPTSLQIQILARTAIGTGA